MIIDKFNNSIYQTKDIINALYTQNSNIVESLIVEPTREIELFENNSSIQLKKINNDLYSVDILDFDRICQEDWFVPEEYKNMDIEEYLIHICPEQNYQRLNDELREYRARNLLPLLCVLKYLIDTFRNNNIVWGVGRGSSVASYVLYLLNVHKIDSVKYNLDWQEFLR